MKVIYDPKPIPDRRHDWQATCDEYEPGDPIGFGATRDEAIEDLAEEIIFKTEQS